MRSWTLGGGADVIIVEVPAELPIVMDQDGNITVPTNASILNHTQDKGVKVSAIEATIASGWTAAEYTDDFTSKPDDTKEMGLSLRNDNMGTNGAFSLSEGNWVIDASGTLLLDMGAKFPKQTTASKSKVATIGFTFDWDDGNGGGVDPNPEPSPDPEPSGYDITIGQGEHGTVDNTNGFKTNAEGKIESFPSTTPDPGYIFDHWEDENGNVITTDTVFDKDTVIKPVFIQDIPDTVTVTFTAEGNGTLQGNTSVTINKGESVTFPTAVPESIRYELSDWVNTATNSSIEPTTPIDSDITIKAVFAARPASPKNWFTTDGANTITGLSAEYLDLVDAPTDLVIPNNIGGSTVKAIGPNAFANKDLITSIVIPNTITSIGIGAFSGCESLTELNLDYAYMGTIANNPFGIADDKIIWAPTEDWDTHPMSITDISDLKLSFNSATGAIKAAKTTLSGEIILPTSVNRVKVTSLDIGAFSECRNLTNVVIPETVTSIGNKAFYKCDKLTRLRLPNTVNSIGSSAFMDCAALESINIPDNIVSIEKETFRGCQKITRLDIPEGVISIGDSAFNECSRLAQIELPKGITAISNYMFYKCYGLKSITIPSGVTIIGSRAFMECGISSLQIPNGVNYIGSYAFSGSDLTSLTIPSNVTEIKEYTFSNCSYLQRVNLHNNVTSIESWAFSQSDGLVEMNMPNSITNLGSNSFRGCSNLKTVKISNQIEDIKGNTFRDCTSLTNVTIPSSVTILYENSFYGCNKLSITVPSTVHNIQVNSFYNVKHVNYNGPSQGRPWGALSMN